MRERRRPRSMRETGFIVTGITLIGFATVATLIHNMTNGENRFSRANPQETRVNPTKPPLLLEAAPTYTPTRIPEPTSTPGIRPFVLPGRETTNSRLRGL